MGKLRNIIAGTMMVGALSAGDAEAQTFEPDSLSTVVAADSASASPKPKNEFSIRIAYDLSAEEAENKWVPRLEGTAKIGGGYIATGWMDLRDNDYFSKTAIVKPLGYGIAARALFGHANEPLTVIGAGPIVKLPGTPSWLELKVGFGIWDRVTEGPELNASVDYWINASLPGDVKLSAYAVLANQAFETGTVWSFNDGEINLTRQFGDVEVQVNTSLSRTENGILTPDVNSRLAVRYIF